MYKFLLIVISLTLITSISWSATLIVNENFDDQVVNSPLKVCDYNTDPFPVGTCTTSDYSFVTGYGGTGKAFQSSNNGGLILYYPTSAWTPDIFYASAQIKYSALTCRGDDNYNMKLFYAFWNGTSGRAHFAAYATDRCWEFDFGYGASYYASWYNSSGVELGYTYMYSTADWADGNWHKFEWFVDFTTNRLKVWVDDEFIGTLDYSGSESSNTIYYLPIPDIDGEEQETFTRQIDDWVLYECASGDSSCENRSFSDLTPPTVSSATVSANGTTVTIVFSETVVTTGYDNGDFDLDCTSSGNGIALNTISGSGDTRTFTAASVIYAGDTCNLDYTGGADEIEDAAGNDLAAFSNTAVTNNSTFVIPKLTGVRITGGSVK